MQFWHANLGTQARHGVCIQGNGCTAVAGVKKVLNKVLWNWKHINVISFRALLTAFLGWIWSNFVCINFTHWKGHITLVIGSSRSHFWFDCLLHLPRVGYCVFSALGMWFFMGQASQSCWHCIPMRKCALDLTETWIMKLHIAKLAPVPNLSCQDFVLINFFSRNTAKPLKSTSSSILFYSKAVKRIELKFDFSSLKPDLELTVWV